MSLNSSFIMGKAAICSYLSARVHAPSQFAMRVGLHALLSLSLSLSLSPPPPPPSLNLTLTTSNLAEIIEQHKPNLMFIHFDSIDDAGHGSYWGSQTYYDAVKVNESIFVILIISVIALF